MGNNWSQYIDNWYALFHTGLLHQAVQWGFPHEEAKDLVQQFFLELLQKEIDPAAINFPEAYLRKAFSRRMIDQYRASRPLKPDTTSDNHQPSILETIIQLQTNQELLKAVTHAYEQLPARCRKVIQLKFYEGLSTEQIAAATGWSTRTVYNNLYEAIRVLRDEFKRTNPRIRTAAIFSLLSVL